MKVTKIYDFYTDALSRSPLLNLNLGEYCPGIHSIKPEGVVRDCSAKFLEWDSENFSTLGAESSVSPGLGNSEDLH